MQQRARWFAAALFVVCSAAVMAADPAPKSGADITLHSTITGNQEQPKVLYIVPWQGPGGADQLDTGLQPIVSDVFAPIDRNEFQRELKYRAMSIEGDKAAE